MPTNDAFTLQALADSSFFRKRVKNSLAKIAWQVLNDGAASVTSKTYARTVLGNLDANVALAAGWIVTRTNVISTTITATLDKGQVVVDSDVLDAALDSQFANDWSAIAGG